MAHSYMYSDTQYFFLIVLKETIPITFDHVHLFLLTSYTTSLYV